MCSWCDYLGVDGILSSAWIHVWFSDMCTWPLAEANGNHVTVSIHLHILMFVCLVSSFAILSFPIFCCCPTSCYFNYYNSSLAWWFTPLKYGKTPAIHTWISGFGYSWFHDKLAFENCIIKEILFFCKIKWFIYLRLCLSTLTFKFTQTMCLFYLRTLHIVFVISSEFSLCFQWCLA